MVEETMVRKNTSGCAGRLLCTQIAPVAIKQPRVDDRKLAELEEQRFGSKILPRHMRRVPSVNNLIPVLYLKGVSTGDFSEAREAILGADAPGLSATNIVRMKSGWEQEYRSWCRRDLSDKRYAYLWADGIHVNVRLDEECSCILVIMGANKEGNKELVAVSDGYRESKAKAMIREMWQALTKEDALSAYRHIVDAWHDKYPKAVECLQKDEQVLFTFYDFPAAHWAHIRTTNPIESTYATIRHRTKRTKGCGSRMATWTMVWKLAMEAQKTWRRLMGYQQLALVMEGRMFVDGELEEAA